MSAEKLCKLQSLATSAMFGVLIAVLPAGTEAHADEGLDKIKQSGTVRIGLAVEPPYTDFKPNGEVTGANPDLVRAVAARLGVKNVTADKVDWGALIPGLQARRFDVVATGLFIRPQRCKAVLFAQPDLCSAEGFIVKKGNPLKLDSYQSLKDSGARVATCGGCTEEKRALEVGVPRSKIMAAADIFNAVELVRSGRADVAAFPDLSLNEALKKVNDPTLEVFSPVKNEPIQCAAPAFNPQDRELRDAYDKEFAALKASGEYAKIASSYGFDPKLAEQVTRNQLCEGEN
jgi:polar amino acid transport system substrate-binding protein